MKRYRLEIIVFLSGAIEMGIELLAARILSPYVGSSNVVWTSIIGVILASMSIGYYLGGKIADKTANFNILLKILLITALITSFIPIFETLIVKSVAGNIENLIISAVICAIIVFSIPSLMLVMISPIAVKIKSEEIKEIGLSSGKISSLSTIGSIVGTFVMGFILIPHIGVSNINIGIVILLILMAILTIEKVDKGQIYAIIFVVSISMIFIILGKYVFKIANPDIVLDTDSEYSRIWVKNVQTQRATYKTLQVDTGLESYLDTNTNEMGAEYLKYYDLFEYLNKDANSSLLIGGAAYTYPMHYLKKYEDKTIDVVEIDNKMTEIAKEYFGLDTNNSRLKIYNQDGRSFFNYSKNKYDVILIDAFKGLNVPFELTTYEAMENAKKLLNNNGIVITNIISSIDGNDSDFIKYEYTTYKKVFDNVKVFKVTKSKKSEEKQNLILIGIKGKLQENKNKLNEYKKMLDTELIDFTSDKNIVTDDFAPVGN